MRFRDRAAAGEALADALAPELSGREPAIVYALPRGGVPVAAAVARRYGLPLDLAIARKIGHPGAPEYALGAVTENGAPVFEDTGWRRIDPQWLAAEVAAAREEAARRRVLYCAGRPRRSAHGRCAILVDDGIATGLTMRAAIRDIAADRPARLIVAVAVAPLDTAQRLDGQVDRIIAAQMPVDFAGAVGAYYVDFGQLTDQDVLNELAAVQDAQQGPP